VARLAEIYLDSLRRSEKPDPEAQAPVGRSGSLLGQST
jgi:hypothetical protein